MVIVGWREMIVLPDLIDHEPIKAKIDTGARTSALHATRIRYEQREGKTWVRFIVQPRQRSHRGEAEALAPLLERRAVRSSNGLAQQRPVIQTTVLLGSERWSIELTLTGRDHMGFRMLLGRSALRGHALVNPARSFIASERPHAP